MRYAIFDVDGVLADFVFAFTELAAARYELEWDTVHSNGAQMDWDFAGGYNGLSSEQVKELWDHIVKSPSFWRLIPPLVAESERSSIDRLAVANIEPLFMTSRNGVDPDKQTKWWLREHKFVDDPQVVIAKDKADACLRLASFGHEIVGIIDDKPSQLEALRDVGLSTYARDWPYNRHVDGVERVGSISEFVARVLK